MSDDTELFDWGTTTPPPSHSDAAVEQRRAAREAYQKKQAAELQARKDKADALTKALRDNADDTKTHIFIAVIEPNIAIEIKRLIGHKPTQHDYMRLDRYVKKYVNKRVREKTSIDKLAAVRLTKSQAALMKMSYGDKHHLAEDPNGETWQEIGEIQARLIVKKVMDQSLSKGLVACTTAIAIITMTK